MLGYRKDPITGKSYQV